MQHGNKENRPGVAGTYPLSDVNTIKNSKTEQKFEKEKNMAKITEKKVGVHENPGQKGERYTDYAIEGKPYRIVVQSTTPANGRRHWFIYEVFPGKDGAVRTLEDKVLRKHAEQFAEDHIKSL